MSSTAEQWHKLVAQLCLLHNIGKKCCQRFSTYVQHIAGAAWAAPSMCCLSPQNTKKLRSKKKEEKKTMAICHLEPRCFCRWIPRMNVGNVLQVLPLHVNSDYSGPSVLHNNLRRKWRKEREERDLLEQGEQWRGFYKSILRRLNMPAEKHTHRIINSELLLQVWLIFLLWAEFFI